MTARYELHVKKSADFRARIFKALGDPTRLNILSLLQNGEKCVSEIVRHVGHVQPVVSRQLKILESCGILEFRKDGNRHFYSITDMRIFKVLESVDVGLMKALSEKIIERMVLSGELKT